MDTITNRNERYKCQLCKKIYQDPSGLRKHKQKKTSCLPIDELNKINNEKIQKETELINELNKINMEKIKKETQLEETVKKLLEKEEEILKKESEIIRLQNLVENNVKDIRDELINVGNKIDTANTNSGTAFNNCVIQSQNNDNKKLKFSIKLAPNEKERYDHIEKEELLYILDQEDFSHSVADLVQAVSFNPKAPENMTWCINDKKADLGALEFNQELNILTRNSSTSVISKNLQTILFPVTDMLKDIQPKSTFTKQQNQNYDRYFDLLGQDTFKKEYINIIRERAFNKRGLCKALWEHLGIGLQIDQIKFKKSKNNT